MLFSGSEGFTAVIIRYCSKCSYKYINVLGIQTAKILFRGSIEKHVDSIVVPEIKMSSQCRRKLELFC